MSTECASGDDVTVNTITAMGGWLRCWCKVAGHIWINTRSRGYFQWACNFWTHIWQGRVILNLQRYCGHPRVTNNPTPCKIVQSSGEVVGSHSDRAVYTSLWIPIERVPFELNALLSGVNSQNLNSTNVAGCTMLPTGSQTPGACLVHQRVQDQSISDPRHLSRTPVWTRHCSLALSHRYIVGMSDPFISIILRKSENWRDFSGIFCTDPTNKKYAQGSSFVVFFVVWYSLNNILQDCRTASLIPRTVSIWSPSFQVMISIITWLCDILALVWHFGPACVTFRPGLCDILALSCVTKASACHHTPILTTGAVYRKFHRSSVSKTT